MGVSLCVKTRGTCQVLFRLELMTLQPTAFCNWKWRRKKLVRQFSLIEWPDGECVFLWSGLLCDSIICALLTHWPKIKHGQMSISQTLFTQCRALFAVAQFFFLSDSFNHSYVNWVSRTWNHRLVNKYTFIKVCYRNRCCRCFCCWLRWVFSRLVWVTENVN